MTLTQVLEYTRLNGGITVDKNLNPYTGLGYGVALSKDTEFILSDKSFNVYVIDSVINLYNDKLSNGLYLGIWLANSNAYFDITEIIEDKARAIEKAKEREQLAIYSFENGQVIEIKG